MPSVVKPVHIFMARNRVSKSCLMAELIYLSYYFYTYILLKVVVADMRYFTRRGFPRFDMISSLQVGIPIL